MGRRGSRLSISLACAALIGEAGIAAAQAPATTPPANWPAPAPAAPQQTTATYEDWIVRCETRPGPPPQKFCEMVQFTQAQSGGVISQIAIGRPAKGQPVKLVIQLPIGVWLPTGIKLTTGAKDAGLLTTFKRCLPAACFTDAEINADTIKKFRTATDAGQILFKDGNQKDASLPVSFKGFATAFDALQKE